MKGLFVISGGPGTGKSTLINALREEGMPCFDEVSRAVIKEANATGSNLLPWKNLDAFAEECFRRMMEQVQMAAGGDYCFFDRGIPDVIAYLRNGKRPVPDYIREVGGCYEKTVFVAPPWQEIFINDDERPQTYAECRAIHQEIVSAYSELGYRIVLLPRVKVEDRVRFVIEAILHKNEQ